MCFKSLPTQTILWLGKQIDSHTPERPQKGKETGGCLWYQAILIKNWSEVINCNYTYFIYTHRENGTLLVLYFSDKINKIPKPCSVHLPRGKPAPCACVHSAEVPDRENLCCWLWGNSRERVGLPGDTPRGAAAPLLGAPGLVQAPLWYHTRCGANYRACHGVCTGFNSLRLEPAKQVWDRVRPQQVCRWHQAEWGSRYSRKGWHPEGPGQGWEVGPHEPSEAQQGAATKKKVAVILWFLCRQFCCWESQTATGTE